ncbi:MAG: biotin/lipoic acid binding domain protein [Candidatus Aminicenantes bacterium]|jgi:biotin carboxyl carrier protein|nr:biotin/lipoic acid binding domain protein [Candidatus Aminicenantes bacterium]
MNFLFWLDRKEVKVNVEPAGDNLIRISVGGTTYDVSVEFIGREEVLLNVDGRIFNVIVHSNSLSHTVFVNGRLFRVEKRSALNTLREEKGRQKKKDVRITMPGRVVQVMSNPGDTVEEGQPVLVLEAMKMQNEIKSPQAGELVRVNFRAGDYAEAGSVLFTVE